MRLKYETGLVTLIQFIVMSLLSLANSLNSIIVTCIHESGQCIENMIPSIILFILIAAWFGFIWILGYTVQERRDRKFTAVLIGAEGMTALIALFSVKHHIDALSLVTSLVDLALSGWVLLLAARIFLAGESRVVSHHHGRGRARRRRPTGDQ
jgi:hypothetical protein